MSQMHKITKNKYILTFALTSVPALKMQCPVFVYLKSFRTALDHCRQSGAFFHFMYLKPIFNLCFFSVGKTL